MDNDFNINTNNYLPLREIVYNTLREAILNGKLQSEERLMENQLAQRLGVSRTPIREALRMLAQENLVGIVPRKGAQVLKMSEKDVKDILEVRASLETLAVELAAIRITDEEVASLKKIHKNFVKAVNSAEFSDMADLDANFHDVIFRASKNDKLLSIVNNLKIQLYRYRLAYLKYTEDNRKLAVKQHNELIKAIENHDSAKAKEVAAKHIKSQSEAIIEVIEK
ncbi:MAG: GntR family transcriptional regulator [Firmicutes bacterium]|nr:GntR family transcriptional regulator [Bacillota bacterium]MBR0105450.1 GntR family transcriptional regulator [Bacillota bacterium]MBR2593781.1 GntR family transcriptional regulator [Bacillota bacterium]